MVQRPWWARVFAVGVERAYLNPSPVGAEPSAGSVAPHARMPDNTVEACADIERTRTGGAPWAAWSASVPAIP